MSEPQGDLVLRTLAMPADTNPNGDIFGGWIMSQMDIAGGLAAKNRCNSRVSTVAVESMSFIHPVKVGDVVCCYADIIRVGNTSMRIKLEVWVMSLPYKSEARHKVTEGSFTYVAIDDNGHPVPVDRS
ncbi:MULTISPECIES: acyl-CoA thioester hydrolase YciA [Gammaproteobacteria]|uniref:acyl-CoA thioester hydrolase YciA n=1 Tax=Gammaproteobacteria TaxID=1236 RepID=UPI001ADC89DF|nr:MULTISPECIES: acyl-CoA thioester hydrolase YciA [Gammaproteobacteria]MBO9483224.1 acyl-CoA thioester hydrolase YciA [Salinisphaera sp. G21_0]MBO9496021.1 acyl-CoA thioester hydrolase YciA [Thalassotalea sp. G20_0]